MPLLGPPPWRPSQRSRRPTVGFASGAAKRSPETPNVFTVGPETSVRRAVALMIDRKIGCLPVVDRGQLVGVVSETDCLRYLAHVLDIAEEKELLPELPTS